MQLLLDRGANINRSDNDNHNVLIKAVQHGQEEMVRYLVERRNDTGLNIEAEDRQERTALFHAATFSAHPDILRILIEGGADVDSLDEQGISPLAEARSMPNLEEIEHILMDAGAGIFI